MLCVHLHTHTRKIHFRVGFCRRLAWIRRSPDTQRQPVGHGLHPPEPGPSQDVERPKRAPHHLRRQCKSAMSHEEECLRV